MCVLFVAFVFVFLSCFPFKVESYLIVSGTWFSLYTSYLVQMPIANFMPSKMPIAELCQLPSYAEYKIRALRIEK